MAAAREALAGVLAGDPDVEVTLGAAEAVIVLSAVSPPLPPLVYPGAATPAGQGLRAALEALAAAIEQAPTPEEALRAGRAAVLVRQALAAATDPAAGLIAGPAVPAAGQEPAARPEAR